VQNLDQSGFPPPEVNAEQSTTLMDIAELLLQHGIKRVPVVRGERLVGIVSRADVIRGQLAEDAARAGES
jgi:CBS domain-containing protein